MPTTRVTDFDRVDQLGQLLAGLAVRDGFRWTVTRDPYPGGEPVLQLREPEAEAVVGLAAAGAALLDMDVRKDARLAERPLAGDICGARSREGLICWRVKHHQLGQVHGRRTAGGRWVWSGQERAEYVTHERP